MEVWFEGSADLGTITGLRVKRIVLSFGIFFYGEFGLRKGGNFVRKFGVETRKWR